MTWTPLFSQVLHFGMICVVLFTTVEGGAQSSFITTWNTMNAGVTANDQIQIPGDGVNYNIFWEEIANPANNGVSIGNGITIISFPSPGVYQIRIDPGSGSFHGIHFNQEGDHNKIISIDQWGDIAWTDMSGAFYGCGNLECDANDIPNLESVKSMANMFRNCSQLNPPSNFNDWDVSSVIDMSNLFHSANSFNSSIHNWNVSSVQNMSGMFNSCSNFNQPLLNWDVSSVEDMSFMFNMASKFNQDIGSWDVSSVQNMRWMFKDAESFNQNISEWDVSSVVNMESMFDSAEEFNQPLGSWDVSSVQEMMRMFSWAIEFDQPIGSWDVSSVLTMSGLFRGCVSFNQELSEWDVSSVQDMSHMFHDAIVFDKSIGNWDVSNVGLMGNMFDGAVSFSRDISNWDVSSVIVFREMFANALVFNRDIGSWDMSSATNMVSMFSGAQSFNHNLGKWDLKSLIKLDGMLDYSGMDCNNYSSTLIGWSADPLPSKNVKLGSVGLHYGLNALEARSFLISNHNWVITGDTMSMIDCPDCLGGPSPLSVDLIGMDSTLIVSGGVAPYDTAFIQSLNWLYVTIIDSIGCNASDSIFLSSLGIHALHEFSISPNPVSDYLRVDAPAKLVGNAFFIRNASGVKVKSGVIISTPMDIDLMTLPAGWYAFTIQSYTLPFFKYE